MPDDQRQDVIEPITTSEPMSLRVGVVDVQQVSGAILINDIEKYFDQRKNRIKQCPPQLYVLFKREDGRRPSWGFNRAYIESPRMLLPGLENLASGRRVATEIVPKSHQAFAFKVAADTSDDAYFDHDVRVVFSIRNPVKFIDTTGLDAKTPESAADVGRRFFEDFMSPLIRARLDSLTKKVDSEGVDALNAHSAIVQRYVFNQSYDVDAALANIAQAARDRTAAQIPPAPEKRYDSHWDSFFKDYGVQLERFVSSIDQSAEIAAANLLKAQARAQAERAKIEADVQLYVQQKKGEAAAAGTVAFIRDIQATLFEVFGDAVKNPQGFRHALAALGEFKVLNNPDPGQRVFVTAGGGGGAGGSGQDTSAAALNARIENILDRRLKEIADASGGSYDGGD
jgi:hypothetical protein